MIRARRYHKWPARLACGHDTLVTKAQVYGRSGVCWVCPGVTTLARSRPIANLLIPAPCPQPDGLPAAAAR